MYGKAQGRVIELLEQKHKDKGYVIAISVTVAEANGKEPQVKFFGRDAVAACAGIKVGDEVIVEADTGSREWQGKRYADVAGTSIKVVRAATEAAPAREPGSDGSPLPFR